MIAQTRLPIRTLLAALLGLACAVLLAHAPSAGATVTPIHYVKETLGEYEKQLGEGQIQSIVINKRIRSLRIALKDGRYFHAKYKPKEGKKVEAALTAKSVSYSVLAPSAAIAEVDAKPVHHKLRYVVGGILIAVIAIIGVVLVVYRRRRLSEE